MKNNPQVNLIIAPSNSGKTKFILKLLSGNKLVVVTDNDTLSDFRKKYAEFLILPLDKLEPIVTIETLLDNVIRGLKPEYVFFTELSAWDENEPRHLDLFLTLANFAVKKHLNVWGKLIIATPEELSILQEVVKKIVTLNVDAQIAEVFLEGGQGIHLAFSAKKYINSRNNF